MPRGGSLVNGNKHWWFGAVGAILGALAEFFARWASS